MSIQIRGTSGNIQDVDANNRAMVNTGSVTVLNAEGEGFGATEEGQLRVSESSVVFFDQIDGNAVNLNKWNPYDVSGMTITQSGGFITLNAGSATTANAYAVLVSKDFIPLIPEFAIKIAMDVKISVLPQANVTIECGLGNPSHAGAITDGVYFRLAPDGTFKAISNNSSVESSGVIANISVNIIHDLDIEIDSSGTDFAIDDIPADEVQIENPPGIPYAVGVTHLPIFFRVFNGSSAPGSAPQISIGRIVVTQETLRPNRTWGETCSILGGGACQSPITPFLQTSNWTNSAAPTTRALSNTTPCETTLQGLLRFTPTYVADTDYVLFAYQVPTGNRLTINQIWYNSPRYFSGTAAATGSALQFGVAINATGASLATAEGSGGWAYRRIPLGLSQLALSPSILTVPSDVGQNIYSFPVGLVIHSGLFFAFFVRALLARTAGASEVHHMSVGVNGFFE